MRTILVISFFLLTLSACDFAGPAYPRRDGPKYLRQKGYSEQDIRALTYNGYLGEEKLRELYKIGSVDVRFLVGEHVGTKGKFLEELLSAPSDFVRSGVARNPNLTNAQIEKLIRDRSHTVLAGLAKNPHLSEATLLRFHKQRKPGLVYFAMNPNCPQAIQEEIRRSSNELAKTWLERAQKRKRPR